MASLSAQLPPTCQIEEKAKGYPNTPSGMPGVETALPVMLTQAVAGKCSIEQVSNWMSTAVAKAYHIPNKGSISIGYDADLVLVDIENYHPIERKDIVSRSRVN
jgi:dihydroorotase